MVSLSLVNGSGAHHGTNGANATAGSSQATLKPSAPGPPEDVYESDTNPPYLDGYTLDELIDARPISSPYQGLLAPPFARLPPLNAESFRSGHQPTTADLAAEMPMSFDGQIPLAMIVDRLTQDAYTNLSELSEIMPGLSDRQRKMRLIQYAEETRKQVIKLYALSKWARVADDVQKVINLGLFLRRSQTHVGAAGLMLQTAAAELSVAKRRNADLINAIDVLATGAYRRLPSVIKEELSDYKPVTNDDMIAALEALNEALCVRLRVHEVLPLPMSDYRIQDGRAHFVIPDMCELALSLTGPEATDYWHMVDIKFLARSDGDETANAIDNIPLWSKNQVIEMLDWTLHVNADEDLDLGERPEMMRRPLIRQRRDPSMMDTPLVRLYNQLQMLCLSFELELLHTQSAAVLAIGWQQFTDNTMSPTRTQFSVDYWRRSPLVLPHLKDGQRPPRPDPAPKYGGSIIFRISDNTISPSRTSGLNRHVRDILMQVQMASKGGPALVAGDKKPTDTIKEFKLMVDWKPASNALALNVRPEDMLLELTIDHLKLNLPALLNKVTYTHSRAIMRALHAQLVALSLKSTYMDPLEFELDEDEETGCRLNVNLSASQTVVVSVDPRTGRITMKDLKSLAASHRNGRFDKKVDYVNLYPDLLISVIMQLKCEMIVLEVRNKAAILGLQATLNPPVARNVLEYKFGRIRACLWIALAAYPDYYLALLITAEELKWALVNTKEVVLNSFREWAIDDFGWLDWDKIGGGNERLRRWDVVAKEEAESELEPRVRPLRKRAEAVSIKTEVVRELYAFCCARVSHTKVEQQLKTRGISWKSIFSSSDTGVGAPSVPQPTIPCSLSPFAPTAQSVPIIWVKCADIIRSADVTALAHDNVMIQLVDWWWNERPCRAITSIKLRDVHPVSEGASTNEHMPTGHIIRPHRNITYNKTTSIISFISDNVNTCVDEFLEEWQKIQRIASIVREVGQTKKRQDWKDVRILSFDLQRVEFAYHPNYEVFIQWVPPSGASTPSVGGLYEMEFSLLSVEADVERMNPHQDVAFFLRDKLKVQAVRSVAEAVQGLIWVLRETVSVLLAVQQVKKSGEGRVTLLYKSAICYRLLYGLKYGLDVKILPGGQVSIMDASAATLPSPFQTLPDLEGAIAAIVPTSSSSFTLKSPPVTFVGNGLICNRSVASEMILKLHQALVARIWPDSSRRGPMVE